VKTLTKTEEEETIIINRPDRSTYPEEKSVLRSGATPGIDGGARVNVGGFSQGQRQYLEFHRENVLRMARGLSKREGSS
jgi:hypothetical protein